jgi:hypothetical protein
MSERMDLPRPLRVTIGTMIATAPRVGVHGDGIAEHRIDDLPRGFHGVLPGEQPAESAGPA